MHTDDHHRGQRDEDEVPEEHLAEVQEVEPPADPGDVDGVLVVGGDVGGDPPGVGSVRGRAGPFIG